MSKPVHSMNAVTLLKLSGLAVLYALLYKFPLIYFATQGEASSVFLASGLALAALLIGGNRYAWSIFLGYCSFMYGEDSASWGCCAWLLPAHREQ